MHPSEEDSGSDFLPRLLNEDIARILCKPLDDVIEQPQAPSNGEGNDDEGKQPGEWDTAQASEDPDKKQGVSNEPELEIKKRHGWTYVP